MFPLLYPWLLIIGILFIILYVVKKRWLYASAIFLSIVIINRLCESFTYGRLFISSLKGSKAIKVMAFNINGSDNIGIEAYKIIEIIKRQNPDLVFLAEFPDHQNEVLVLDSLLSSHFKYKTYQRQGYGHYFYGKYPLINNNRLKDDAGNPIGVYECKICIDNDTIALFGCHLASNNYTTNKKYITPDSIKTYTDMFTYFVDIQEAYKQRIHEIKSIQGEIANLNIPILLMGDLNDVGGSVTVKLLKEVGLRDAWWEGGWGYGATISKPLPYRLDHIFFSSQFSIHGVNVIDSRDVSDHQAISAEFSIEEQLCSNKDLNHLK